MRVTVSFFRKYAGGTLVDTSSTEKSRLPVYFMNKYQYLLKKKESGELSILFELGLPVHLSGWMEYYAFHLAHPEMSNVEISYYFTATKSTIQRAIAFMDSPIA